MIGRHVSGAVLAGGGSTRFGGRPKGLVELDGRRLIDRVLDALQSVVDETFVIANDPVVRAALSGIPVYDDVRPERASLVGLHSALTHCREGALVVAWDMPFASSALLTYLRDVGVVAGAAAIPVGPRGPEPLCAYYPRSLLPVIERHVDARELRLSAFVDALSNPILIPADDISRFGEPRMMFANINTLADLDHLTMAPHLEHQ